MAYEYPHSCEEEGSGLAVVGNKVRLFSPTERASPIVWDGFKGSAGGDAAIGVSHFGIVDVPAKFTDVLLHNSFLFLLFSFSSYFLRAKVVVVGA